MTIRHLKIFITVADEGSMSAAASKLYLSQPTISQAIRELEKHYDFLLFERSGKKLFLTQQGSLLLPQARQVVGEFDRLEISMEQKNISSFLRLGSSITVGTCLVPSIVKELKTVLPDTEVCSLVSNTNTIEQKLLRFELDAAIVEGEVQSPNLISIPIIEDTLVLFCGQDHPFYLRDSLCPFDLNEQRFAIREEGSGTRKLFENYLLKHNLNIKIAWEANSPRAIINSVMKNNTLAVMSYRLIRHEIIRKTVRIFYNESDEWNRQFKLVLHKNKTITPEIELLQTILENYKSNRLPDNTSRLSS